MDVFKLPIEQYKWYSVLQTCFMKKTFFYQGVQDASFYRSQLLRIQNFVKDPTFPQSREICENTERKLPYILQIKWVLYMYEDNHLIRLTYNDHVT